MDPQNITNGVQTKICVVPSVVPFLLMRYINRRFIYLLYFTPILKTVAPPEIATVS